ncbi:hypothetical protein FORMB_24370 [Formosa sp. Hel1_33_131]|jgi:hypothetical protein|uniref:hypothetical protein n=1 Tax=Formosa sp. Hel1_33_131 TaxID=1336794 RepID=UPI00084E2DBE|nr:hypothetical protein [Formosa sp. Hel1_33_131]AOR29455.1 hypothetical protein FORMB_24370 [Formosa sp. Hel1_33_131]
MTTITIKDGQKLPKTEFGTIKDFLEWAVDHFQEEIPLSEKTIKKAAKAKKEISSPNSTFKPAL